MKVIKYGLVAVGIGLAGFGLVRLRTRHVQVRHEVAALRREIRGLEALRQENLRLRERMRSAGSSDAADDVATAQEIARLRNAIATLEAKAPAISPDESVRANRNPETGLVRLEDFEAAGRATPSAAFQSLVAAAFHADNGALAELLVLSETARAKAERLFALQPPAAREKFPRPENLAAVAVAGELMKGGALELPGTTHDGAGQARVRFRTSEGTEGEVQLQLVSGGWALVVPERAIDALGRRMAELQLPKR